MPVGMLQASIGPNLVEGPHLLLYIFPIGFFYQSIQCRVVKGQINLSLVTAIQQHPSCLDQYTQYSVWFDHNPAYIYGPTRALCWIHTHTRLNDPYSSVLRLEHLYCGTVSKDSDGNTYLIVSIDPFSKWVELKAIPFLHSW